MVKIMTKTAKALIIALAVLAFLIQPGVARPQEKIDEVTMGREAAAEVEKEVKLYDDPVALERVQRIGQAIAHVANTVEVPAIYGSSKIIEFDYSFKIIDEEDVNAFSLPGGFIYVYRGLLDFVESDHELAGVLAHEVAHASHHHMIQLLKEQQKMDNKIAILLLAGLLGKVPGTDLGNIVIGAQLYRIAIVSGYGQQAERDADLTAVRYMIEAGYNPVGLLTFLERLARNPELINWGIFRTHPESGERAALIRDKLKDLDIAINRRLVRNAPKASVRPVTVDGLTVSEVIIGEKILYRPAPENGVGSEDRANQVAERINSLLDDGLQLRDVRASADRPTVLAKGEPLIEVSLSDAALLEKEPMAIAKQAADDIRMVLWRQMVDGIY